MKLFISWSGDRSRSIATSLKAFLPNVLAQKVEPFLSSADIGKGQRSMAVLDAELESTDFGVVVLTMDNQHEQWINYEAGALGRSLKAGRVAPLLVDLTPADVTGPLSLFQMTSLTKRDDVLHLVQNINGSLEDPMPPETVEVLFDRYWTNFEAEFATVAASNGPVKTMRDSNDMLEEILSIARSLERRQPVSRDELLVDAKIDQVREELSTFVGPYSFSSALATGDQLDSMTIHIAAPSDVLRMSGRAQAAEMSTRTNVDLTLLFTDGVVWKFFADGRSPAKSNPRAEKDSSN